jgi:hypothetical protein
MNLVLPAALAILLQLQPARHRLLVLRRRVVALLTFGALQCDDFPHSKILFQLLAFSSQPSVRISRDELKAES